METLLYKKAFDNTIWKNEEKINYLKDNIKKIEAVAEKYLKSISEDFPQLTDHSLKHSKMLWNYANIIVGDKKKFLNPIEAFVLHIAFLIHDSGMCFSILNNKKEIEEDFLYTDFIKQNGDSIEIKNAALFYTVRQRHGDFALRVATDKLRDDEYLIQDINLREELGEIIGKIAKSHSCNINYIEREFGISYCNPNFPTDWAIDCQKLSFILRTSDAAHIDNLRTPKSFKMIKEISGESKEHWTFQKKLGFPQLSEDNLLIYTTNTPFRTNEQKAWWFCHDSLMVLDKELKNANEYFEVKKKESFSAKGVKSIHDTLHLGKNYIKTFGWTSVDTKVKVTDPIHIATELGGVKLYGNINFAVRELIQNSIDAINLYRVQTGQDNINVGEIKLSIEKKNEDYYFTITDNGIGMSQTLLTNELLDFGGSYWKSNRFNIEHEGAWTKGFKSIGKFGIGFFSIFMLGENITVTSWKYGEGINMMKTLDFYDGLKSIPILREPTSDEKRCVIDRGTSIKIKLFEDPYSIKGFIGNSQFIDNTFFTLTKYFCPSSNVKISINELNGIEKSIQPNYLYSLTLIPFVDYVNFPKQNNPYNGILEIYKSLKIDLIEISDNDIIYGKLVMLPQIGNIGISSLAIILSKGIRINEIGGMLGYVITDDVVSIKRDSFTKLIPYEILKKWAIKQKHMIEINNLKDLYSISYIGLLMTFNLFDNMLPIALSKKTNKYSYVSIQQLKSILINKTEINFYIEGHTSSGRLPECEGLILLQHRFGISNIVKDEDQNKLINYKDLIGSIIKEVWGDYKMEQENLMMKNGYNTEMPYLLIEKYTKL
ncbi:MAG: ATP-binding protein [Paludibacter sp.]|nr:ATP-binding protein [Paludibacter sp.]